MFYHTITSRIRSISWLRTTLLSASLLDEIVTGFAVVGVPLIRDQFGLSYSQVGLLFTAGALTAMVLDPIISMLSDRSSKRYWILGGYLAAAICSLLAGTTASFMILLFALALSSPANEAAIGLSQAALIDDNIQASTMLRWTMLASIGDLLSPLIVSFMVSLHLGWSALCWVSAIVWLGMATIIGPQRFPRPATINSDNEERDNVTQWASLRKALCDPFILRWSLLTLIPTMVDEILLGFAALYLHDILHVSQGMVGLILTISMLGSLVGLLALDRLPLFRKFAPQRLLIYLALLVLVAMVVFLSVHNVWLATISLFLIHLGAAGWYPIAKGQAYARHPGQSGMVRAIISLGAPLEVALPGIVGLVAGQFGLLAGLGLLGLAPVFVLMLTLGYKKE